MTNKVVAYLRSSTSESKQTYSLERQKFIINQFCEQNNLEIEDWFEEYASGKYGFDRRPILKSAVLKAREKKMPIIVSSISRLSRNVSFGSSLFESKEEKIYVADLRMEVNRFTINILLAVAQNESEMISKRVSQGMALAKERGVKFGGIQSEEGLKRAQNKRRQQGLMTYEKYIKPIEDAQELGCTTNSEIAERLNNWGLKSPQGKKVSPMLIWRILNRKQKHKPREKNINQEKKI